MENTVNETTQTAAVQETGFEKFKRVYSKIEHVIGVVLMVLYRLRKIVMAAPVIYYALKLARYNTVNLPEQVGLFLQNSGEFAQMIDRSLAVSGPFMLTCACLVMMFLCRKAMYAWSVSIFTLVLPVLLFISNTYPA